MWFCQSMLGRGAGYARVSNLKQSFLPYYYTLEKITNLKSIFLSNHTLLLFTSNAVLLLENADVVHFHCGRERVFVDTLSTAPVASPCEVEDEVERAVEGPCFHLAGTIVVEGEQGVVVDIGFDIIFSPFEAVDVEVVLSAGGETFGCFLCAFHMVVAVAVNRR